MLVLPQDEDSTYRVNKSLKIDASCKYPVNNHAALACAPEYAEMRVVQSSVAVPFDSQSFCVDLGVCSTEGKYSALKILLICLRRRS